MVDVGGIGVGVGGDVGDGVGSGVVACGVVDDGVGFSGDIYWWR